MVKSKSKFKADKYFHCKLVLDASVLLKIFFEEDNSEEVEKLFKMARKKELTIIVPPLIRFEILNVLAKNVKNSEKIVEAFEVLKKLNLMTMEPRAKFELEALKSASANKNITFYDASYHALAKDFDATFITADKKYYGNIDDKKDIYLIS